MLEVKQAVSNLGLNIALPGFEPGSAGPEPAILDHYTTGLSNVHEIGSRLKISKLANIFPIINKFKYLFFLDKL